MKGIRVEKRLPVGSRRRCDNVVEGALHEIRVLGVSGGQQEPPAQHHRRDAGTSLAVCAIAGQFEVLAECLVLMVGSHTPRDVGASRHGARPLGLDGVQQRGVTGVDRQVDRSCCEIKSSYCMAAEDVRIPNRNVVLKVLSPELDLP